MKRTVCILMVLGFSVCAQAILVTDVVGTYYDATTDNTWATDSVSYPNLEDWSYVTPTSVVYNSWYRKTGSTTAIDGTAFQGEGVTLPELTTTIADLDPIKTYEVYVIYHARNSGGDWYVYAGLESESLTLYDETNATHILSTGTLISCETLLGTVTGVSSLSVYIDGPETSSNGGQRAWYDGIALVEVPEPATMLLLGVGGILVSRKK